MVRGIHAASSPACLTKHALMAWYPIQTSVTELSRHSHLLYVIISSSTSSRRLRLTPWPLHLLPRPWMRRGAPLPSPQSHLMMGTPVFPLHHPVHTQPRPQRQQTAARTPIPVQVKVRRIFFLNKQLSGLWCVAGYSFCVYVLSVWERESTNSLWWVWTCLE